MWVEIIGIMVWVESIGIMYWIATEILYLSMPKVKLLLLSTLVLRDTCTRMYTTSSVHILPGHSYQVHY